MARVSLSASAMAPSCSDRPCPPRPPESQDVAVRPPACRRVLKVLAKTAYARLDELTAGIDRDRAAQFVEAGVDLLERATARPALQRSGRQERDTGLLGKPRRPCQRERASKRERAALRSLLAQHRNAVGEDRSTKRSMLRSRSRMRTTETPRQRWRKAQISRSRRAHGCAPPG